MTFAYWPPVPVVRTVEDMERPVDVSASVRALLDDVCALLVDDPGAALRPELRVDLLEGGSVVQTVVFELGVLDRRGDEATLPVAWHAVARHRPLPLFRGALILHELPHEHGTAVTLAGAYRPPLRALGQFADGLIGHRLARASLLRFMEETATRIDAAVDQRKTFRPPLARERLHASREG